VGIDPGTNTGIAILDLHGKLVHLSSKRNMGKSEIISKIIKFGQPLIVTVDVSPTPKNVYKIAASMGSVLFVPEKSMSNIEKHKFVKAFKKKYKKENGVELKTGDKHERDALAAAIKAWKGNAHTFNKIEDTLKKKNLESVLDEVVSLLIKEESDNLSNAIKKILKK